MSFNPHQEILEKFEFLYSRIDTLEGMIKAQQEIPAHTFEKDILFTAKQLAEYWQCHPQTIHNKKRDGLLPFLQNQRKVLFSKKAIDKLTTVSLSKNKGTTR